MYGSDYWSTERRCMDKMAVCGISLGTSLFPYCLLFNSWPVNWFATFLRSPFSCSSFVGPTTAGPTPQWLGFFSIPAVQPNAGNCPSFLKPNPEGLEGFNGLQIWDRTHVWETRSRMLRSRSPSWRLRNLTSLSVISCGGWGTVWLAAGFCLETHSCHLRSFCTVFALTDLREEVVLQGIKSGEVFLQIAPRELRFRRDPVENSREADINDISRIQWSKCIKNSQGWRYLEIWFWRSKHAQC